MLLIAVSYRRCGRNLRAKWDTVINSLSANHAYLKTLYIKVTCCNVVFRRRSKSYFNHVTFMCTENYLIAAGIMKGLRKSRFLWIKIKTLVYWCTIHPIIHMIINALNRWATVYSFTGYSFFQAELYAILNCTSLLGNSFLTDQSP